MELFPGPMIFFLIFSTGGFFPLARATNCGGNIIANTITDEKVYIPLEKPCIILEGAGSESTLISYGDHGITDISATFTSLPQYVVAIGIGFKNCTMNAVGRYSSLGFVTAQRRVSTNDSSGFVFKGGSIVGSNKVNLGRAWGPHSRVILDRFTYAEVVCEGAGADTSRRVQWGKKLNRSQIEQHFSVTSFINTDRWLHNLPIIS
ncbi:putative pectinesterase 52 [Abrus precatorius]|uniref:Pectinesterase 52 n=1 Tax=Abrus precatorius TaxID=3816 RepID=A0A8B8ML09_ABRPR|nr:putative pectinesterase 52 [Abrus precatorius]